VTGIDLVWLLPAVLALVEWYAVWRRDRRTQLWAKPAVLVALIVTALALGARPPAGTPQCVSPEAVHELRLVATWLDAHPDTPVLSLDPPPEPESVARFAARAESADQTVVPEHVVRVLRRHREGVGGVV